MKKVATIILLILLAFTLFPRLITKWNDTDQNSKGVLLTSSVEHLAGTDELGRDLMARLLFGTRVSLSCAFLATIISGLFGIIYGLISGYYGGWIDQIMMRIVDILYAIPDLVIYILLGVFLGRSFFGLVVAFCLMEWLTIARIMRGEVLKTKELPLIEGARALGFSNTRILFSHIFPQSWSMIKIALILKIPHIILTESTLSFLGLGLKPPYASLGTLALEGYQALQFYAHLLIFPVTLIFVTIWSLNTLGRKI